jgi:hypothetical protein
MPEPEVKAAVPDEAFPVKEDTYTKLFGQGGVGITPGKRGKELIDTHITRKSHDALSVLDKASEIAEKTNQDYIDRFAPFLKVGKEVYETAMDSTKANNLANRTIRDKRVDLEGNVIGDSLEDVYKNVPRGMQHLADRYVIARDSISRMDRNIQVWGKEKWFPQTSKDAADLVANLETRYPWLKKYGEKWNEYNRAGQDLAVKEGIASQKLIDTLRFTNPNYAPMFRQQPRGSMGKKLAINTGKAGFSNQKLNVKRAVGSGRKIIEPAQGMIEQTASSYNAMLRNRALQALHKQVLADPERFKDVVRIVEETPEAKKATADKLTAAIKENGAEGIVDMLNEEVTHLVCKAKQGN